MQKLEEIARSILQHIENEVEANIQQLAIARFEVLINGKDFKIFWVVRNEVKRTWRTIKDILGNLTEIDQEKPLVYRHDGTVISRESTFFMTVQRWKVGERYEFNKLNYKLISYAQYLPVVENRDVVDGFILCEGINNNRLDFSSLKNCLKSDSFENNKRQIKRLLNSDIRFRETPVLDKAQAEIGRKKLLHGSLIINGGAGTGKKNVLVQRLTLLTSVQIDNIPESEAENLKTNWSLFVPSKRSKNFIIRTLEREGLKNYDTNTLVWNDVKTELVSFDFSLVGTREGCFSVYNSEKFFYSFRFFSITRLLESFEIFFPQLQNFIAPIPKPREIATAFKRFRKTDIYQMFIAASQRKNFKNLIEKNDNKIFNEEIDLLLFLVLKSCKLFHNKYESESDNSNDKYIVTYRQHCKPVIAIDQAHEFSLLELACMQELSDYKYNCVTLAGDLTQSIKKNGIKSWTEYANLTYENTVDIQYNLTKSYRQTGTLFKITNKLYSQINKAEKSNFEPYFPISEFDSKPLKFISKNLDEKVKWIIERIVEIRERSDNRIPSTAIFVKDKATMEEFERIAKSMMLENAIPFAACYGENDMGQTGQVRLFEIKHIKGLEFEALFIVDIDTMKLKDNLLRYLYVGVSRAHSFVGLTFNNVQATIKEIIDNDFIEGDWNIESI